MSDCEETPTGHVELKEGISLDSVLKGQTFEINFENICNDEDERNIPQEEDLEAFAKIRLDLDSDDEENDTPFEKLALKMKNVTKDGKIKKLIKREGVGKTLPEHALVSIMYSCYLEFADEPTDYAYIKRPYQFRIGTAKLIGLNFAVETMKVNEKAYFLIDPYYAYGVMGHPPRIPPNATFLFVIELLRFSDSGPALQYDKLSSDEKKRFPSAYKTALGLMENAKEHLKRNTKLAIRDYNRALNLMEECILQDMEEQEEQQKLRLRLLTNLAICYNKESQPKRACSMCNLIYCMVKNTSLKVPTKVYFNNGRALMMIGEYFQAKEKLLKAQRLEPQNTDISEELLKVNAKIQAEKQKEKKLAQKFIKTKDELPTKEVKNVDDTDSFRQTITDLCKDLLESEDGQYTLPSGLTSGELDIAKEVAENLGFKFRESKHNENGGKLSFYFTRM